MATDHNFIVKNGLEVGGVLIVNSNGSLAPLTNHIKLNDNVQLQFGTGTDSNIRHDGSNTKFTHTGSGGLYIGANTFGIQNGAHNENYIMAAANGAVTVYYDGSLRLSTTTTGIKVEGASGNITIGAQNTTGLHIYTDRDRFYFNKQISLIDNTLTSYNADLVLKRVGSTKLTLTSGGVSVGGTLTGTTANFQTASTTDYVLRLSDTGVASYDVIFPDTSTYQLTTNTTSNKTFKLLNSGSGTFNLNVEGAISINGTTVIDSSRNLTNIGTINTGQGATEVYAMNQNVRSSDSPTFQDLTIQGNLSITGDINSYNVTDLDVVDKTITLGVGGTASANNGGGIVVDGANAKLTWGNSAARWTMNKSLQFSDTATTTNQAMGVFWPGFDKEATSDYSDNAKIIHTTNTGGHTGSVLLIESQNDANDGIAFTTNSSSPLKHNSNTIWTSGNDGASSGLNADLLDDQHGSYYQNASNINAGTLSNSRLPTNLGSTKTLSGANAILKLQETDVTNSPTWWHVADGGNYSIRLNNTGAYPIRIETDSDNDAVTQIGLNYTVDLNSNKLQFGTETTSYIQNQNKQGTDVWRFQTEDGYIDIGSENTSWAHLTSDRNSFYFNPKITVDGNVEPYGDSSHSLGTNTLRWANVYADTLYGDGSNITGVTGTDSTKLPLAGGTMTGTLNMGGNAFTGNNFNISGVNQISLNDPGEGIVFGSNCNLYLLDDAADNILRLDAPGGFRLHNGPLSMGTTTVIDTSRNLTNIGTISSAKLTVNSGAGVSQFHSHHTTGHDDWQVSPISIRERGLNTNSSTNNQYSPNLNFHWASVVSRSLTMTSDGNFTLGEWTASGTPSLTGSLSFLNTAGYRVNNTNVIDSSRNLTNIGTISSGAISATSIGVTNIVTNKIVKFNGSILDDANITDTGSLITLGSNTAVTGKIQLNDGADIQWAGGYGSNKPLIAANANVLNFYTHGASGGVEFALTGSAVDFKNNPATNVGTISSGSQTITSDSYTKIYSSTNGGSSGLRFSDHAGGSYAQYGDIKYYHADGSSYGSGNAFVVTSSESTTTILADGKLMFKEGLYVKPSSGTGAGTQIIDSSRNLTNIGTITATGSVSSGSLIRGRNTHEDDETLFAITDNDDTASIRAKFETSSSAYNKYDDADAPASGVFTVAGSVNPTWGAYIPIDDDSEIMFETWAKHISGSDNTGNFYAGAQFYNGSKTSLGNNSRYWGANGDGQDSDHTTWRHIKGVMKGSSIRSVSATSTSKYMRFLTLFNYNASGNTTAFCGFRFYRSKKTISSLYLKRHQSSPYNDSNWQSTEAGTVSQIIDNDGNIYAPGSITVAGSLAGKSDNTTEIGTYTTGAIKRIRMAQGGELHFGDTTTSSPLGITEGAWNNFGDQDRMSIYYRSSLKLFSGTSEKFAFDNSGNFTAIGNVTVNGNLYIGDGNDGYFYNDVAGRTAFRSGDFYIQDTVTNFYNYATNQYYGDSSGDNIHFRGNVLNGTGWSINGAGKFSTRDIQPEAGYVLMRSNHHSGHLEGSYNNVGDNALKSNPIYTIGSSYNPNSTTLSNMYGIGYTNASSSFIGVTGAGGWGMYVAADGDARVWLDGSNGIISSTGEHYANGSRVFHDAYHPNADTLTTARTINGVSFNGSANITVADSTKLPLGGGTMTGQLTLNNDLYIDEYMYHAGDTNTYIRFNSDDIRIRTGGDDRFIANNTLNYSQVPLEIKCEGGNNATDGGRFLSVAYSGNNRIATMSSQYSSGDLCIGNGLAYDQGNTGLVSTFGNFSRPRSGILVNGGSIEMVGTSGAVQTAVDSAVTAPTRHTFNTQNGNYTATGDVTAFSDERLKDDIKVIDNAVEKVKQVRGVTFTRNDLKDNRRHAGVIAQEVEKVLPEVVLQSEDTKTVAYGNMVGLLIEAIKEQQETIEKLTSRINDIEKGE